MRTSTTVLGVLALAGTGLATAPAAAGEPAQAIASTSTEYGDRAVFFEAIGSQVNHEVTITAGEGRAHPDAADPTYVLCTLPETGQTPPRVYVQLGDGADRLVLRAGQTYTAGGGAGDDHLDAVGGGNLLGHQGDDTLVGGGVANGGPGDDTLRAFHDAGEGQDGDGTLIGGDRADEIYGGKGHDTVHAEGGGDLVYATSGEDTVHGGPGDDRLSGGPGVDEVRQS